MPFTYNGFGTKFYGEGDLRPDGSFITTEWITAAYIPVLPLKSFRLARAQGNVAAVVFHSQSYAVFETLPICWPQVWRIYAFVLSTAAWWFAIGWLAFAKLAILDGPKAPYFMFLFVIVMLIPFGAVWWFRREAYRARHSSRLEPPTS
jgi:hypothetical protein